MTISPMISLFSFFKFLPLETIAAAHLQSRYCTNLQLPSTVQKAASHIAQKAVDMDLAPG